MKEEPILRSALSDILKGYSYDKDRKMFIKHLRLEDYVDYEEKYDEYFNALRKRGVETSEELMTRVIKQGLWSEKQDLEFKELEQSLDVAQKTYDKLIVPDQKKEQKKYLEELKEKYYLLFYQKESFTAKCCENLTNDRVNKYYIINSLFKDSNFEEPFLSEEEKEDTDVDFEPLISSYNKVSDRISVTNIKKIAIKDFFRNAWDLTDNAYYYFGVPLCKITYFQSNLATYAEMFGNIFKNYPNIKSDDPDKILEHAQRAQEMERKGYKEGKATIMGMSSDEAAQAGITMPDRSKQFEEAFKKQNSKG